MQTFKNSLNGYSGNVASVRLNYRVYRNGTTPGSFTVVNIPFNSDQGGNYNASPGFLQTWAQTAAGINLISSLPAGSPLGAYTVEVYFDLTDSGNGSTIFSSNGGSDYKATFTLAQQFTPAGQSTTWISNTNTTAGTDWLNSLNWSNGVPTSTSDATIPDHASGTPSTESPQLNDPNALYEVRNLTMPNSNFTDRSVLRLGQSVAGGAATNLGATLQVYGNVTAPGGGLLGSVIDTQGSANSLTNSTLVYAGSSDQLFDGEFNIADVRVAGGGIKKLHGSFNILNTLTFPANSTTSLQTTDVNGVLEQNQADALVDLADVGRVLGESETASVQGTLKASSSGASNGFSSTFGNIGLTITTPGTVPSLTVVTRTTQFNFSSNSPGGIPPNKVGIKRIYGVSGGANNVSGGTETIIFRYLDQELNGLSEPDLAIFRTASGNSGPFVQLGGVVDTNNNTITLGGLTSVNTISANDKNVPLPVSLTAFNAVREGTNAVLTWATASETDSKGFEIEVSTDGNLFRTLGFVASQSPNSLSARTYRYVDAEAGKSGNRYYRLRQVDLSGKSAYSGVKVVSFDGSAALNGKLAAYPNPFTSSISLTLDGASAVHVRLVDLTGRLVLDRNIAGDTNPTLSGLENLNAGLYLAKVTMADGTTQVVRVQKQ